MSFSADITAFAKEASATVDEAARAIKIELFSSIIRDTRVDTGRLRGNWQTSTGSPIYTEIERRDQVAQYAPGGEAEQEVMRRVSAQGVDYLTNNLPYARTWEEQDAMIERNMARIQRIVTEAVRNAQR